MKILVIGGGGREHTIAWKLKKDHPEAELFIAPGNAGTALVGENLEIDPTNVAALTAWAKQNQPDYTFVGPEAPLCAGVVDALESEGVVCFGPKKDAARLEGSKIFSKELLQKYKLPTGEARSFTSAFEAHAYSQQLGLPQVVKADGLAAGKGVIIAETAWDATRGIDRIMREREFGAAGDGVLIEEFLVGREASVHVITDGKTYQYLPVAQDHKRIGDGGTGPNTGGMGAYAPANSVDDAMRERLSREIFDPLFEGLRAEGIEYKGVLYGGFILTEDGPKVLEFNVRFGDPETQVMLPLLKTSLIDVAKAVNDGTLADLKLEFAPGGCVGVVMASRNYPDKPVLGDAIKGLEELRVREPDVVVFHAGTKLRRDKVVTSGGRVLCVSAVADDINVAADRAYEGVAAIEFSGAQFRKDIRPY